MTEVDKDVKVRGRVIAIGDIHGCYYTLRNLLDKIKPTPKDKLIFIGDYIDRGKHSFEVLSLLRKMQRDFGPDHVCLLRGNHEQMMIDAIKTGNEFLWKYNGGGKTKKSFYKNGAKFMPFVHWMETFPLCVERAHCIFCHAGLTEQNIKDNTPEQLLWARDWIEENDQPREKLVVFGHTPGPAPYKTKDGSICIDGGAVFGGNLVAVINPARSCMSFVSVPQAEEDK